jgi:hypothetical protein
MKYNYITMAAWGRYHHISRERVRQFVLAGRLKFKRFGRVVLIDIREPFPERQKRGPKGPWKNKRIDIG